MSKKVKLEDKVICVDCDWCQDIKGKYDTHVCPKCNGRGWNPLDGEFGRDEEGLKKAFLNSYNHTKNKVFEAFDFFKSKQ